MISLASTRSCHMGGIVISLASTHIVINLVSIRPIICRRPSQDGLARVKTIVRACFLIELSTIVVDVSGTRPQLFLLYNLIIPYNTYILT